MRAQGYGAECEHGRLARKCERCADADEIASLRDCAKQYEQWLAQDHATIADLRDRLRVMAPMVCEWCGCAPASGDGLGPCQDCQEARNVFWLDLPAQYSTTAACISVGLRALCGRLLLDGCEAGSGEGE